MGLGRDADDVVPPLYRRLACAPTVRRTARRRMAQISCGNLFRKFKAKQNYEILFFKKVLTSNCTMCIIQLNRVTRLIQFGGAYLISFEDFIQENGIPIYLQILRHIKRGVVAGIVQNGDELPSRRVLSALLGINPNTIQKAYKMLEDEGLIESRAGAKSYMSLDSEKAERIRIQLLENNVGGIVSSLKQMGLSKEDAISLIEKHWEN